MSTSASASASASHRRRPHPCPTVASLLWSIQLESNRLRIGSPTLDTSGSSKFARAHAAISRRGSVRLLCASLGSPLCSTPLPKTVPVGRNLPKTSPNRIESNQSESCSPPAPARRRRSAAGCRFRLVSVFAQRHATILRPRLHDKQCSSRRRHPPIVEHRPRRPRNRRPPAQPIVPCNCRCSKPSTLREGIPARSCLKRCAILSRNCAKSQHQRYQLTELIPDILAKVRRRPRPWPFGSFWTRRRTQRLAFQLRRHSFNNDKMSNSPPKSKKSNCHFIKFLAHPKN